MFSEGDLGYILHPDYWRQGLATVAIHAVIDHAWTTTDYPQLQAGLDPRNAGSKALLTRLGFVQTGFTANTHYINDIWSDSIYMTLPRPESLQN